MQLRPGREEPLRRGRPWVYRSEVARVQGTPESGDVVQVRDSRGRFVGRGFYHRTSQLAVRLLTRSPHVPVDEGLLAERLRAAIAYRAQLLDPGTPCRLVFAEADGLPGLIVDKLGSVLVLQVLSAGMERRLPFICTQLAELTGVGDIFSRDDSPVRELEGLEQRVGPVWGDPPEVVQITENGLRLEVRLREGQKTGHFLDQRENRALFGQLVHRLLVAGAAAPTGLPVLDAFCHTGGFGLQALAAGAKEVLFVDTSAAALQAAARNADLNGLRGYRLQTANAFDLLRQLDAAGQRFAAVVLDPPAFARGKQQLDAAYRGYKEINLRAMRLLAPGGLLCTSSCSQAITMEMFTAMLQDAAADAGRRLRIIARRTAPPDHPGLLGAESTEYLKCCFLQAMD